MANKKSSVEIALDFPIKIDGVECSRLTLRRPKVGDILAAEEGAKGRGEKETEILTFANLCQVTPAEIRDLDLGDYQKLAKAFSAFFVLTREDAMRGTLALASHTGWSLAEISEMTAEELVDWCGKLPK